jgi:hypothetical protein
MSAGVRVEVPAALVEEVRRELDRNGYRTAHPSGRVQFGAKIGPVQISATEVIELVEAGPDLVDAIAETLRRIGKHLHVEPDPSTGTVHVKHPQAPLKGGEFPRPGSIFEQFIRLREGYRSNE